MPQEHTLALRSFRDLDHHGKSTHGVDGMFDVVHATDVHRAGNRDVVSREQLARTQFVAALEDRRGTDGRPNPFLVKVAEQGGAVVRDGMTDSRNDGVVGKGFTVHEDLDLSVGDQQGAREGVDHGHVDAAVERCLDQASCAVQPRAP